MAKGGIFQLTRKAALRAPYELLRLVLKAFLPRQLGREVGGQNNCAGRIAAPGTIAGGGTSRCSAYFEIGHPPEPEASYLRLSSQAVRRAEGVTTTNRPRKSGEKNEMRVKTPARHWE